MAPGDENAHCNDTLQALQSVHHQLDAAWQEYLHLLDDYTAARNALQKHMSAGFFSLAQANFKSTGKRYGRDYYDQRAVATARVKLEPPKVSEAHQDGGHIVHEDGSPRVMLAKLDPPKAEITGMEEETLSGKLSKATFDSKVETSAEEKSKSEPQSATSTDNNEEASAKPPVDAHDPIRQFGILLPPALRTAQNSFNSAVLNDDCIAKAVEAARGMRRVEAEIRKLRKEARKSERGERLRGAGGVDVGGG